MATVMDVTPSPSGDYAAAPPSAADPATAPSNSRGRSSSPLSSLARTWFAFRWQLARVVFARPLPYWTAHWDVKLGDLVVTMPIAVGLIAWGAALTSRYEVKETSTPAIIAIIATFALAVRNNSILLAATGLPFERALFYHKLAGAVAIVTAGLHGLAWLLEDAGFTARRRRRLGHRDGGEGGISMSRESSGAVAFFLMVALGLFSLYPIRRRFFELFVRLHWLLFLLVLVFCLLHGAGGVLFGAVPWALDVLVRFGLRLAWRHGPRGVLHASQVQVTRLPGDLVRIQFPRSAFAYEAGQYVFLCVPGVAAFEWHPFTIASAPHEPLVTIYVKALGDWTRKLAHMASPAGASGASAPMTVLVDGPYGAPSIDLTASSSPYSHVVFFSGGIGITPMLALANQLHHEASTQAQTRRQHLKKARFVWSGRERELLDALLLRPSDERKVATATTASASSASTTTAPLTWLPGALVGPMSANVPRDAFFAEFFLTRGAQDLSEAVDQRLGHCLRHGQRPDIARILGELGELAKGAGGKNARVGVLVCGPATLMRDVQRESLAATRRLGVAFDVHTETFDF